MLRWIAIGVLAAAFSVWWVLQQLLDEPAPLAEFTLERRPQSERYLFDYGKLLTHFEEGAHHYLDTLNKRFHIEAFIITLPNHVGWPDTNTLAVDIVNRWDIGRESEGRGILLLLVQDGYQVRLEVSYELEDVFTDAFAGIVEDRQLKPYFLNDDLGTGLIAVMEELERRAQIKQQGDYTPELIARLDQELLSGGAGAQRTLTDYQERQVEDTPRPARGADTPEQAWQIMLSKWAGKGRDLNVAVYTELTRMAMGDPDQPDPRTKQFLAHWSNASYQVLENADHAVIFFDDKKGWENAPFLFCRTQQGWQFDIVHQRRLVVMGKHPNWFIEYGRFPYVDLLRSVSQSNGKDLPLDKADLYSCAHDAQIAERIRVLESRRQQAPDDSAALLELIKLNVITGRRPNHVMPLIQRAKQQLPEHPEPYKYAAIYNVNVFFQYDTASKEILEYLQYGGDPAFGYSVLGFTYARLRRYDDAIEALEQALVHDPESVYALSWLARVYGLKYRQALKQGKSGSGFAERARDTLARTRRSPSEESGRIERVARWLRKIGVAL